MGSFRRAMITIDRVLKSTSKTHPNPIAVTASLVRSQAITRHRSSYENYGVYRYYSDNNGNIESLEVDLSNEESKRRLFNRLVYRSKQRGFLELDLVLGKWVEEHIHSLDESGIRSLFHVLELENPDLWKWLTVQEQPPDAVKINPVFMAIRGKVMNNLDSHASPETRAKAGQPWVRGWDDYKKGRDSPITGNQ
ncbi:hypothetical protein UlMin_028423 [Ulmus minor]